MRNRFVYVVLILFAVVFYGCTTTQTVVEPQTIPEVNNRYDTEYPIKDISKSIDFLSTTVKKLDCLAFYKSYVFPRNNNIDEKGITKEVLEDQSISINVTNQSVSGTATVIYYDGIRIGLLTCAHVVDFPETIITRFDNGTGPIEVVALKIKQQNFVKDLPIGEDIEILAMDEKNDIAMLGKELENQGGLLPVFNFKVGNTRDLDWGSVVYTMGYPIGYLMVTRAIVSNPDRARRGKFLTDALYNRGISGGPVVAIRDGTPNFELVGIASSASANQVYYLKPGTESSEYIQLDVPYDGQLYVDQYKDIKYGVTFNVSVEDIISFLNNNKTEFAAKGYDVDRFFK